MHLQEESVKCTSFDHGCVQASGGRVRHDGFGCWNKVGMRARHGCGGREGRGERTLSEGRHRGTARPAPRSLLSVPRKWQPSMCVTNCCVAKASTCDTIAALSTIHMIRHASQASRQGVLDGDPSPLRVYVASLGCIGQPPRRYSNDQCVSKTICV